VTVMSDGTVITGAELTVMVNEPPAVPATLSAVQAMVCTPEEKWSPEVTGVTSSKQLMVGVGKPVAVTVNATFAPAPGEDSPTEMSDGTVMVG